MSEYIVDLSNVEETSDHFKLLFCESIPLVKKIVRCRDCKFYKHNSFHRCDLRMQAVEVEPDGFCAWAKRRGS